MLARLHRRFFWRGHGHDLTIDGAHSRLYARLARWPFRGMYRRIAAEVGAAAPRGATVLDVGTGPGQLLVELGRRRPDLRITGIDLSPDMVALAGDNVRRAGLGDRVTIRAADVADLPFEDGSFDLVVSTLSMHHWAAVAPAVAELARVLRPGGAAWIYDLRSVPGDVLDDAVRAAFGGPPQRKVPGAGGILPRLTARWTATAPPRPGA